VHTHGEPGHEHHGGGHGLVWELLDSIMLACFVVVCGLLAEIAYRQWRARRDGVRYDLTPSGLAATTPAPGDDPAREEG